MVSLVGRLGLLLWATVASLPTHLNFSSIADEGTYSCQELQRWVKTEKHYSNDRKNSLFQLMTESTCASSQAIQLSEVSYSQPSKNKDHKFFTQKERTKCAVKDAIAVIFLSNFSINHNFSHFLHGLLRLFCSLIDSRLLQWNSTSQQFVSSAEFVVWLDENFKLAGNLLEWLQPFGRHRELKDLPRGGCATAETLVYGSGCVKLLPPEKWFGYPGCRADHILPAFASFMKASYGILQRLPVVQMGSTPHSKTLTELTDSIPSGHLNIAFGIRRVGSLTGTRSISNLASVRPLPPPLPLPFPSRAVALIEPQVQTHLSRSLRLKHQLFNISFEEMSPRQVLDSMSRVHIFISVHGAGLTNTFFMSPGTAVVEILPFPLCSCRSPDYFYGVGGYYQGSSLALGLRHYVHCVDSYRTKFQSKPSSGVGGGGADGDTPPLSQNQNNIAQSKCNWKHLHSVREVDLDEGQFVSLLRAIERDLIASGMVELSSPVININPHANG
jgi:hypothetical protein